MKRRSLVLGSAAAFILFASGCAPVLAGSSYPVGLFYSDVQAPHSATLVEADGEGKTGSKRGEACATGVLGLAAWGDASVDAAKKQAGITDVHTVEHNRNNILVFYYQGCTVVTGE